MMVTLVDFILPSKLRRFQLFVCCFSGAASQFVRATWARTPLLNIIHSISDFWFGEAQAYRMFEWAASMLVW